MSTNHSDEQRNLFRVMSRGVKDLFHAMIVTSDGRVNIPRLLFLISLAVISALVTVASQMTAFIGRPNHQGGILPDEFNLVRLCVALIFADGIAFGIFIIIENHFGKYYEGMVGKASEEKAERIRLVKRLLQATANIMERKLRGGKLSIESKDNIISNLEYCRHEIQKTDLPARTVLSERLLLVIGNLAEPTVLRETDVKSYRPKRNWPSEFVESAIGELQEMAETLNGV